MRKYNKRKRYVSRRKSFGKKRRKYSASRRSFKRKVVSIIRGQAEVKRKINNAQGHITTAWSQFHLTNISQGTDIFNRVGDTIFQKKVSIKARLYMNTGPLQLTTSVRMIVVRGKWPLVVTVPIAQILEDITHPITSLYNREMMKNWELLDDHVFNLDVLKTLIPVYRKYSLEGKVQTFSGPLNTTSTYGDVYLLIYADNANATDVWWDYQAAYYYTDT